MSRKEFREKYFPNERVIYRRDKWTIISDQRIPGQHSYDFYPPKSRSRRIFFLDKTPVVGIEINKDQTEIGGGRGVDELEIWWATSYDARKFIDLGSKFLNSISPLLVPTRRERVRRSTYGNIDEDPFVLPGISLHPADVLDTRYYDVKLFNLPEAGQLIDTNEIETIIKKDFPGYNLNQFSISISIATESCHFSWSPPNVPPGHAGTDFARIFLQQRPVLLSGVIYPLVKESSLYDLPWNYFQRVLQKVGTHNL